MPAEQNLVFDHSHGDEGQGERPGPNPHVWTSVCKAAALVDGIADTLSDPDPDGAERCAANAAHYRGQLRELHDAWTYFARDHDLAFVAALQSVDVSDPSAGELRAVIDEIRRSDVPTVFGSEVFPTSR